MAAGAQARRVTGEETMNKYAIVLTRHYYGPTVSKGFATDQQGDVTTYKTRRDARLAIEDMDAQVYELSNNESSRPTYQILRVKD